MSASPNLTRRFVLTAAAATGGAALLPRRAFAATPMSFQLSWIKSIQYGGYFAGIENGVFASHGVDPTFNSGGPNIDPISNVIAGQSMIGDRPIGPIIVAREKGVPLKVIGTVFQRSPFSIMSLASSPINSVAELRGKSIAVGTSNRPLMENLLREAGVDPAEVDIVPSSPDPSALVSGQIDAYSGYATNQGVMLQTRGVEIVTLNAHDLGMPETAGTIYTTEENLAKHRDLIVSFLRAARESWSWALDHPAETAKLMVEKYGAPGLDYTAQLTEIKASRPYIEAGAAQTGGLLAIDPALYERIIGLYRKVGIVQSDMTAEALCDPTLIADASA